MSHRMDDLEFLLPAELLTDDDLLADFGSPVESVIGSDEDDFVSELTRKFAHSTLRGHDYPAEGLKLSGSPQSTLSGFLPGSTTAAFSSPDALSWDALYAAAEEVARIRMVEEAAAFYASNIFGPARIPKSGSGVYSNSAQTHPHPNPNPNHSYQQFQAAKFQQMTEYFLQKEMRDVGADLAYGSSISAWPTLKQSQHYAGSAFPRETLPAKQRVGTGVFMPRNSRPIPPETRHEPVMKGWNGEPMFATGTGTGTFIPDHDVIMKQRKDVLMSVNQGRSVRPNQEHRLPQEWTY